MKKRLLLPIFLMGFSVFAQTIELETFATNIIQPVEIVNAGTTQLYVAGQNGIITMLEADGTINPTPFLDISSQIEFGGEHGLLGLAFHPDYVTNGYLYVNYINAEGNTVIARYTRDANNPNIADPDSKLVILNITQLYGYHQGGCLRFGPHGFLYISSGDGGESLMGQNIDTMLGKILRIDVNTGNPYSVPYPNPFYGTDNVGEIWAYGLRNPWKFSFNPIDDTIWIADVGQDNIEEINKVSAIVGGLNYGWRCYEGTAIYNSQGDCPEESVVTFPYAEYTHSGTEGCSITGGYVYNGQAYPGMRNKYFFADYCSNKIGWVNSVTPGEISWSQSFTGNFTTIGQDVNGELYIGGGSNNTIYKITDTAIASIDEVSKISIAIYPNPARNEVFIDMKNQAASGEVTIFDLGGKRLMQQMLTANVSSIDTSVLQSGIYLLEVNASGNKTQQKLIIN